MSEEDERDLFFVVGGQGKEEGDAEIGIGGNSTEHVKERIVDRRYCIPTIIIYQ